MKNNLFISKMTTCMAALLLPVWLAAQGMPTPIAYGESITDTINPASDVDLFTVTAMPGDILWIRVSPVSTVMNPKIEVRTPQGAPFGVIVMAQSAFEMVQFIDTIPINGGGTYTILVSDVGANNTGRFCITVDRFNSPPASNLLKCNASISSSIGCNSSIESFRYLVQQNSISRIVVSPVSSVADLHVWICTPDGAVIAEDSAETFEAVTIDVTAAQTDCFYVFVGDTEGDNTGGFSISHALIFGECATATIQTSPPDGMVCAGSSFTLSAVTPLDNPSFLWSGPNGFTSTQQTIQLTNVTSSQAGTYTVTVTNPSHCSSTASATITVKPTPTTVNPPTNQMVCGTKVLAVTFSSTPSNATFNWTNSNPAIGLPASGSGNLNFTAANVAVSESALITVAPTLNGCTGASHNFTITVNPTPTVNDPVDQTVCGGAVLNVNFVGTQNNAIYNWTNSNPAIGLPSSGSGNIAFTAANVASQQTGMVTVTPVLDACTGPSQNFTITVKITPTVSDPADKMACGGTSVFVPFTGTAGATYNWTNSNPAIGLPASGSGNLNFTAANVAVSETALITVAPTLNGCTGASQEFTITVNPTPTVNDPVDQTVCGGELVSIHFASAPPGATFNWTNSNPAIGLPPSGSGDIEFTAATTAQFATLTVTPTLNGCFGTGQSFIISINPTPTMSTPADKTACGGTSVVVLFTGTAGATYNWMNSNPAIGLPASGSGNLNFTAANVTAPESAIITVTPSLAGCTGAPVDFPITVNPTPTMSDPANQAVCEGELMTINFSSNPPGASFNWTNSNTAIGLAASGTGNIVFNTADVSTLQNGTITVTPVWAGCPGPPQTFIVSVNPEPTANFSVTVEDSTATFFNSSLNSDTLSWDFGDGNGSSSPNPSHTYTNTGPYTVTLTVTNDCGTDAFTQEIFVVVGVEDLNWIESFTLYPNPGDGIFTVHLAGTPLEQLDFELFDLTGKMLEKQSHDFKAGEMTHTFDFGDLPAAIYLLRVRAAERAFYVKVMVE
ncbi:MAG: PKD domain-containing protein [Haliscomenobacteraceae bacterium CHB4]|nr:PKD domain-containing protein [Haliscomenobacteraceae bacterium CHB4]